MKIQIVQVELFDNIFSVKEKLAHTKASRVIFIDTSDSQIFQDPKTAKLIYRSAQKMGKEFGVVTQNNAGIMTLKDIKIKSFPDLLSAQQYNWEPERFQDIDRFPAVQSRSLFFRHKPEEKTIPSWLRLISFYLAFIAVIILALIFVPGAEITIQAPTQLQTFQIPALVVTNVSTRGQTSLIAQPITIETEVFSTSRVNGNTLVAAGKASGTVEFTNLANEPVQIPAGTILGSNSDPTKQYVTLAEADLSAGSDQKTRIKVESLFPGSNGNAIENEVQTVLGSLGLTVKVTNPDPISGGSEIDQPTATSTDKARLKENASSDLLNVGLVEIEKNLPDSLLLLPQTIVLSEITSEQYYFTGNSSNPELALSLKGKVSSLALPITQITSFVEPYLDSLIPAGFVGSEDVTINDCHVVKMNDDGSINITIDTTRKIVEYIDTGSVAKQIAGKTTEEAADQLSRRYALNSPVIIQAFPAWWKILPYLPLRIKVQITG